MKAVGRKEPDRMVLDKMGDCKRMGKMALGKKELDMMVLNKMALGKKVLYMMALNKMVLDTKEQDKKRMDKKRMGKKVLDKMVDWGCIVSRPLLLRLRLHARHLVVFCRMDRSHRCTAEMDILVCSLADILACNRCNRMAWAHKYVREHPDIPIVRASRTGLNSATVGWRTDDLDQTARHSPVAERDSTLRFAGRR
jgi:hypothetical protein